MPTIKSTGTVCLSASPLLLISLSILLLVSSCKKKEEVVVREVVRPVKLMTIERAGREGIRRAYPGKVRASQRVDLAFKVSGPLIELPVQEAQMVKKGEVLARILPRDFETAVAKARAQALEAEQQYSRYRDLYIKKQVSKADFDKYKSQYDIAQAQLKEAQDALDDTFLRAPFSGVIARRYMENFADVQAKEPVVSLQDISRVEVLVDLPEQVMANVRENKPGTKMAYAEFAVAPARQFPLSLKEYKTEADPDTQTYQVTLEMEQPEGINVLPGMTANVIGKRISTEDDDPMEGEQGVVIPASAVFSDEAGSSHVWIVDPGAMTVSRRTVATGELAGTDSIEIIDGLQTGETIAVTAVTQLREGMKVRSFDMGSMEQRP
ncbi:MAG: efflux RND transporter periplasmic adaptor subunit [Nitrospiraceae bacterium]|nr:MAG: efflux RND transporter periplasmic adaptor subunit [Nitrospiraceae bacterium]